VEAMGLDGTTGCAQGPDHGAGARADPQRRSPGGRARRGRRWSRGPAALLLVCVGLASAACGSGGSTLEPAAAPQPTVQDRVEDKPSTQPPYTATLHLPEVTWAGHAAVANRINAAINAWASTELASFSASVTQDLAGAHDLPASLPASSLTVTDQTTMLSATVLSFQLLAEPYDTGAAHAAQTPDGLTFNLSTGAAYTLPGLFRADGGYVAALAQQASNGLAAFQPAGAHCYLGTAPAASAGSFSAWWLSPDGLVLAFPAGLYTADYCGPATVSVPYAQLKTIAATGSPLTAF